MYFPINSENLIAKIQVRSLSLPQWSDGVLKLAYCIGHNRSIRVTKSKSLVKYLTSVIFTVSIVWFSIQTQYLKKFKTNKKYLRQTRNLKNSKKN